MSPIRFMPSCEFRALFYRFWRRERRGFYIPGRLTLVRRCATGSIPVVVIPPVIPPPPALRVLVFLARRSPRSSLSSRSWPWAAANVYHDERSRTTTTATRRRSTTALRRFRSFDLFAFEQFLVNFEELAFLISN